MPADVTAEDVQLNQVLDTMDLDTNPAQYDIVCRVKGRKVSFYCDVAWQYSNESAGTYLDVPAHPQGLEITLVQPTTSIFAKVPSGTGTLTPIVTG